LTEDEVVALGSAGWFVRDGVVVPDGVLAALGPTDQWKSAGTSRHGRLDAAVRGDRHRWVDPEDVLFKPHFGVFEQLRGELNTDAWLGLRRFELQVAFFPGGGTHYVRHRDALAGTTERRITAICYLNPAWVEADGGKLRLFVEPVQDIAPLLGRLVVFRSALVEHEVLPAFAERYAATAWYYGA
jgi:SM-20-related protein